jgi:hypothetical protein
MPRGERRDVDIEVAEEWRPFSAASNMFRAAQRRI